MRATPHVTAPGRPFLPAWAAAILAVVLLSHASVKSMVMQAAPTSTAAPCAMAMAGMDAGAMAMGQAGAKKAPAKGSPAACPFCSAAAHAPIMTLACPIVTPTLVGWRLRPLIGAVGVRGPPAQSPKARGPPSPAETA